ncbi:hypothetical protein PoB_001523900 [Plakobranchus ocellatus]|uniref:Uncharacterized protein n=1 Tax=Plakobranchus ocellatus TaxID=259542 RepID=A0AAV3Z418_9GAST|nr:hypothetical protein PoB_001523900 [Plakobranchus ocellatus]
MWNRVWIRVWITVRIRAWFLDTKKYFGDLRLIRLRLARVPVAGNQARAYKPLRITKRYCLPYQQLRIGSSTAWKYTIKKTRKDEDLSINQSITRLASQRGRSFPSKRRGISLLRLCQIFYPPSFMK